MSLLVFNLVITSIISAALIKWFIPVLVKLKFGQNIRELGPKEHLKKAGTPTMGGAIFIPVAVIVSALAGVFSRVYPVLYLTAGFCIIGFIDDYLKILKEKNEGLNEKEKISLQLLASVLFLFIVSDGNTFIALPFTNSVLELSYFYYPFLILVILGTTNGVNLTDGLDGLSTSVTIIALAFFALIGYKMDMNIALISVIFIGALLGFLYFNVSPAKIFMGDTGSLALGGLVAGIAIYLKMPIIILFVGFVYFMNALSVIMQVSYYKMTKKRIFKMAPLHHHFELSGYDENRIVILFSILTLIFASIGYFGYSWMF